MKMKMKIGTRKQLLQAKRLIQAGRYHDAQRLLITIDSPIADKWLARLQQLQPVPPQKNSSDLQAAPDFTVPFALSVLGLLFFVVPGLIVLAIYGKKAKRFPDGTYAKHVYWLNRITFSLIAVIMTFVLLGTILSVL